MARWQAADIKRRLRGHRTGKTSQTVGHGSLVTWAVTTDMSHKSSRNHVGEHPTHQAHNHSAIVTAKRPFRASCKPDNVLRQAPEGAGGRSDARSGTGGRRRPVRRSVRHRRAPAAGQTLGQAPEGAGGRSDARHRSSSALAAR